MNKHLYIILVVTACITFLPSTGNAQSKKGLKKGTEAALTRQLPENTFRWPENLVSSIQAAAKAAASSVQTPLTAARTPAMTLQQKVQKVALDPTTMYLSFGNMSPGISLLQLSAEEREFYDKQIKQGADLRDKIVAITELTPELQSSLQAQIDQLPQQPIREVLTSSLQKGDLQSIIRDINDYYALDHSVAFSSYEYLVRHPQQPTLGIIRLLTNPLVDPALQETVRGLVYKKELTPEEQQMLRTKTQQIQAEYFKCLEQAKRSDGLQFRLAFYRKTIEDLQTFINKHGRRPDWNTRDNEEFRLYRSIELIFAYKGRNSSIPDLQEVHKQLQELWEAHTPVYWTREQTLEELEKFIQRTGLWYPRNYRSNPDISDEEATLWTQLMYWRTQDYTVSGEVSAIQYRYRDHLLKKE